MATKDNAWAAFAGESQASRKYAAFAEKANEQGMKNIARLFQAASEAEMIHARKLILALKAVGSTEENLTAAVEGETHEFTEMYPGFLKEAEAEKQSETALVFTYAMKAEEVHAGLYKEALKALKAGQDLSNRKVLLCPICGNIFLGDAPDRCPICNAFKKIFKEIV